MRASYHKDATRFSYASPSAHLGLLGLALLVLGLLIWRMELLVAGSVPFLRYIAPYMWGLRCILLGVGTLALVVALVLAITLPDSVRLCRMVRRSPYCPAYGNPLHLKDGELLPKITCSKATDGIGYTLTIRVQTRPAEDIKGLASFLSSSLVGRYKNYAVTGKDTAVTNNSVTFNLDDVTIDHRMVISSIEALRPTSSTIPRV